jgi:hypothetical protein
MPVIVLLFRQAAWARGGHLGGNCPKRQTVFAKLWFLVTANEGGRHHLPPFFTFPNAIVMTGRCSTAAIAVQLITRITRPRQRFYLVPLVGAGCADA